jgi:glyoxylase-like metal-dependent hydrolase (beta-lactamase superfamily II)
VSSCYIIRHGSEFMLWDTGMSVGHSLSDGISKAIGPKRGVKDILVEHGIKPEQIKFIGISHNHFDHLGQASEFPHAKLFIGAEDWMNMKDLPGSGALYLFLPPRTAVQPWLDNEANVEPLLVGDRDIFGDGSVVMLNMPGHTPGHHSLLVRLKDRGAILLTGDLYEWQENFETDAVLEYATNRADQLASQDRFKRIRRNLRATVIIQHEPADVAKLPAFPDWAE